VAASLPEASQHGLGKLAEMLVARRRLRRDFSSSCGDSSDLPGRDASSLADWPATCLADCGGGSSSFVFGESLGRVEDAAHLPLLPLAAFLRMLLEVLLRCVRGGGGTSTRKNPGRGKESARVLRRGDVAGRQVGGIVQDVIDGHGAIPIVNTKPPHHPQGRRMIDTDERTRGARPERSAENTDQATHKSEGASKPAPLETHTHSPAAWRRACW